MDYSITSINIWYLFIILSIIIFLAIGAIIILLTIVKKLYNKNYILENKLLLAIELINTETNSIFKIDGYSEYISDINFKQIINKLLLIRDELNNINNVKEN